MSILSGKKDKLLSLYLMVLDTYLTAHDRFFTLIDNIQLNVWLKVTTHKESLTLAKTSETTHNLSTEDHSNYEDIR